MKTKYIFASLLVSSLAVTGCQDMDTLPDGGIVTDSQKELNVIMILVILLSCCVWTLIQKT